ncbi:hypothetical protein OSTOST_20189 [Ostertagia ostertagi]
MFLKTPKEDEETLAVVPVNSCRVCHTETFWKVNLLSLVRYERERAIAAAKEADRIQNLFLRKAAMKERDLRMNFQRALHAHDEYVKSWMERNRTMRGLSRGRSRRPNY